MAFIQVQFEVPLWVQQGVASGEYNIFGGVVRDLNGQIVHHLKNAVDLPKKAKGKVIVVAIAAALAAGICYALYKFLNKKQRLANQLENFDDYLQLYLQEATSKELSINTIKKLHSTCEQIINMHDDHKKIGNIEVVNKSRIKEITIAIRDYTEKLSESNSIDKKIPELANDDSIVGRIIDIRDLLQLQREIVEIKAA